MVVRRGALAGSPPGSRGEGASELARARVLFDDRPQFTCVDKCGPVVACGTDRGTVYVYLAPLWRLARVVVPPPGESRCRIDLLRLGMGGRLLAVFARGWACIWHLDLREEPPLRSPPALVRSTSASEPAPSSATSPPVARSFSGGAEAPRFTVASENLLVTHAGHGKHEVLDAKWDSPQLGSSHLTRMHTIGMATVWPPLDPARPISLLSCDSNGQVVRVSMGRISAGGKVAGLPPAMQVLWVSPGNVACKRLVVLPPKSRRVALAGIGSELVELDDALPLLLPPQLRLQAWQRLESSPWFAVDLEDGSQLEFSSSLEVVSSRSGVVSSCLAMPSSSLIDGDVRLATWEANAEDDGRQSVALGFVVGSEVVESNVVLMRGRSVVGVHLAKGGASSVGKESSTCATMASDHLGSSPQKELRTFPRQPLRVSASLSDPATISSATAEHDEDGSLTRDAWNVRSAMLASLMSREGFGDVSVATASLSLWARDVLDCANPCMSRCFYFGVNRQAVLPWGGTVEHASFLRPGQLPGQCLGMIHSDAVDVVPFSCPCTGAVVLSRADKPAIEPVDMGGSARRPRGNSGLDSLREWRSRRSSQSVAVAAAGGEQRDSLRRSIVRASPLLTPVDTPPEDVRFSVFLVRITSPQQVWRFRQSCTSDADAETIGTTVTEQLRSAALDRVHLSPLPVLQLCSLLAAGSDPVGVTPGVTAGDEDLDAEMQLAGSVARVIGLRQRAVEALGAKAGSEGRPPPSSSVQGSRLLKRLSLAFQPRSKVESADQTGLPMLSDSEFGELAAHTALASLAPAFVQAIQRAFVVTSLADITSGVLSNRSLLESRGVSTTAPPPEQPKSRLSLALSSIASARSPRSVPNCVVRGRVLMELLCRKSAQPIELTALLPEPFCSDPSRLLGVLSKVEIPLGVCGANGITAPQAMLDTARDVTVINGAVCMSEGAAEKALRLLESLVSECKLEGKVEKTALGILKSACRTATGADALFLCRGLFGPHAIVSPSSEGSVWGGVREGASVPEGAIQIEVNALDRTVLITAPNTFDVFLPHQIGARLEDDDVDDPDATDGGDWRLRPWVRLRVDVQEKGWLHEARRQRWVTVKTPVELSS
jgi:hypothetical protein